MSSTCSPSSSRRAVMSLSWRARRIISLREGMLAASSQRCIVTSVRSRIGFCTSSIRLSAWPDALAKPGVDMLSSRKLDQALNQRSIERFQASVGVGGGFSPSGTGWASAVQARAQSSHDCCHALAKSGGLLVVMHALLGSAGRPSGICPYPTPPLPLAAATSGQNGFSSGGEERPRPARLDRGSVVPAALRLVFRDHDVGRLDDRDHPLPLGQSELLD